MESRRLERQRRESAKSSAAITLPSTQDRMFNLRLIDLYGRHACLWNTALGDYENVELKRSAWEDISSQLGSHLSTSFVRSRISNLRYRLNLYKLQVIEYKMNPGGIKQPEKPYYIDNFAYLEQIANVPMQLSSATDLGKSEPKSESIASIFKQRVQQQQQLEHLHQLPLVLQHLGSSHRLKESPHSSLEDSSDVSIASVVQKRLQQQQLSPANMVPTPKNNYILPKLPESLLSARRLLQKAQEQRQEQQQLAAEVKQSLLPNKSCSITEVDSMLKQRMQRLSLVEQGRESSTLASLDSFSDIPSVVQRRIRQQLPLNKQHSSESEQSSSQSFTKMPQKLLNTTPNSCPLRALPGDSVSKIKMEKYFEQAKQLEAGESQHHSDDDDLYRLHWSVRKQNRSRRQSAPGLKRERHLQPVPLLLLGRVTTPASQMEDSTQDK